MVTKKTTKTAVTKTNVIKSAKTGEFVTKEHAKTHPTTTFKQTVVKSAPIPKKAKVTKATTKTTPKVTKKAASSPTKKLDVIVKDTSSPQLPTHSDTQINKLVGKVKTPVKKSAARMSASRAEVLQTAVSDARAIFK